MDGGGTSIAGRAQATEACDQVINAIAHPFASTPLEPGRKGAQEATIRAACLDLWPPDGGVPADLGVAERNRLIWGWYARRRVNGEPADPSERHIRRLFNGR